MRKHDGPRLYTRQFALVQATAFLYFFSYGVTLPILPRLVKGPLGLGEVAVGIAAAAYAVTSVFARPLAGRLGDRSGRKILITGGALIVAITTLATLIAEPIKEASSGFIALGALVATRLVLGVGEGAFFTGATTMVSDLAPEARRGEAISLFTLSLYGGLALGPVAGEMVFGGDRFNAVWIFSGAAAILAFVLGAAIRETRPETEPGRVQQHRLVHPAALAPGAVIATSTWAFAGFSAFLPLYVLTLGMKGSGPVFLTYSLVIVAVRLLGARLPDRFGPKKTASAAMIGSIAGLLIIGLARSVAGVFAGAIILALGQSLAFPALVSLAVRSAPAAERGSVVGTFTAFVDIGFGLGPLTLGVVASAFGYPAVFLGGAVSASIGLAILQSRREQRPDRPG